MPVSTVKTSINLKFCRIERLSNKSDFEVTYLLKDTIEKAAIEKTRKTVSKHHHNFLK